MKKLHYGFSIAMLIGASVFLGLLMRKVLSFWLNDSDPSVLTIFPVLMSIIFIIVISIIFYMFWRNHQSTDISKEGNQNTLKNTLSKQKKLQAVQIREVVEYLTTTFKFITKNKIRLFRRLPCYLGISAKDAESHLFFEKSHLDFLSTSALAQENILSGPYRSLCQWYISRHAVILNLEAKQESFWGIQAESHHWLGTLRFLRKFRRYRTLNGILITLNFPHFVIQPENIVSEHIKELSTLIKMLYQQFGYHIPVYFILTKTNAIAGFNEFFADLNAEQRSQAWGLRFPAERHLNVDHSLSHFENEFDQLMNTLHTRLFVRLETEKEMARRAQMACFPQQIILCKHALKQLILKTDDLFIRGIYFVGTAATQKTYNFALSTMGRRFGLSVPESKASTSIYDNFSQKILPDYILKDVDASQKKSQFQLFKKNIHQLRWMIALVILSGSSIGFSVSYANNNDDIHTMMEMLPQFQQAYAALTSSDTSLDAPVEALEIFSAIQKSFHRRHSPFETYFLLYVPFKINNTLNHSFQELLSTQFMPRVLLRLENILKNNTHHPEILYKALKGYLAFSPAAAGHPEWIEPPIQNDINTKDNFSTEIKSELIQYLNKALTYPVDSLPLNQKLVDITRENLKRIPPALFAYQELKSQSETSEDQFQLDQVIPSDFNAVFIYKDPSQDNIPQLFTKKGFMSLHNKNTDNLISYTADVYQILGLSKDRNTSGLVTTMNPQVWHYYNQDYIRAWTLYLNNIQIKDFNDIDQAIQVLTLLTQSHNPLIEILEKISENTAIINDHQMTVGKDCSALNTFTGPPGKPSAQYKILIKNLGNLRDYLSNLSTSPDVPQAEFQEAAVYLQNKSSNSPIGILKRQAQQLPFPLNNWINSIADNCFNILLKGSRLVINTAWQNIVVPAYRTNIENRFPFNSQSDSEVNLSSFGNFFGNNGIFSVFLKTYLSPFINTSDTAWSEYKVGSYSLGLSPMVLKQLEEADKIRIFFFPNNTLTPNVNFFIQPRILDAHTKSVYVQLSNQNLIYRHGPQQIFNWHWPAANNTQQVSVVFNDFSGKTSSITLEGPWAWFSLLHATEFQPTGVPGHTIWTIDQKGHQASFDVWTANNQPVFDLDVLQNFNLPPVI